MTIIASIVVTLQEGRDVYCVTFEPGGQITVTSRHMLSKTWEHQRNADVPHIIDAAHRAMIAGAVE